MQETNDHPDRLKRGLLQRLQSLARSGIRQLPAARTVLSMPATAPQNTVLPETVDVGSVEQPDSADTLETLRREVAACTLCHELAATRTQTVFGVGNSGASLCFLGEAPGADEDRQGEPFVGRAGQLLTDIIEKGMKLQRSDVYILNILKCRPPGNRNPATDEVAHCRHYFERQLRVIRPKFICCLGSVAAQNLLQTNVSVGRLRGKFHDWEGVRVLVTYHPAYLLRNPAAKKDTWEDIKMLMRELNLPV